MKEITKHARRWPTKVQFISHKPYIELKIEHFGDHPMFLSLVSVSLALMTRCAVRQPRHDLRRALQLRSEVRMVSPAMDPAMMSTMYILRANCAQRGGGARGGGLISASLLSYRSLDLRNGDITWPSRFALLTGYKSLSFKIFFFKGGEGEGRPFSATLLFFPTKSAKTRRVDSNRSRRFLGVVQVGTYLWRHA